MEHILTMANLKLKPSLFTPHPTPHLLIFVTGYHKICLKVHKFLYRGIACCHKRIKDKGKPTQTIDFCW